MPVRRPICRDQQAAYVAGSALARPRKLPLTQLRVGTSAAQAEVSEPVSRPGKGPGLLISGGCFQHRQTPAGLPNRAWNGRPARDRNPSDPWRDFWPPVARFLAPLINRSISLSYISSLCSTSSASSLAISRFLSGLCSSSSTSFPSPRFRSSIWFPLSCSSTCSSLSTCIRSLPNSEVHSHAN